MKSLVSRTLLFSFGLMLAATTGAQGRHDENGSTHGLTHSTGQGTVTQLDAVAKKVTLDHNPIPKLKMEAGTHAFRLRSERTAANVNVGDRVDFSIETRGNVREITRLSRQK